MIFHFDIWNRGTPAGHQHLQERFRVVNYSIGLTREQDGRYHDRLVCDIPISESWMGEIVELTKEIESLEGILDVYVRECPEGRLMRLPREDPSDYK